jgi:hypothetical protein
MTFAISLQLPARGTGLAGPAGRRRAGSWKHARARRRLSRRRPGAHVRALSRLLQPCRHRVIRPACSHPQMPRDPIRMLARVTRSRQRPMNPTFLRERGAVVDDGAHQGSDGTRPAGRTRPGPGVPGPQLTRSATGDAAATSEPDQVEVLDDGPVVIVGAVAGRAENHARERTARRRQSTSRRLASRMCPLGG